MFESILIKIFGSELYTALVSSNPELIAVFIIIFFFAFLMLIFNLIKEIFSVGGKI